LQPAPPETVRVGLVATYANWKGHGVFLDALARVPGVRGYIVGGPIYTTVGSQVTRAGLEARAEQLQLNGRIGFVPFQSDPRGVYRMLDVVVNASTRPEAFGLTIAEAMSCGRAVIASETAGVGEVFQPQFDAWTCTSNDPASLAHAIDRLARNPQMRSQLGRNARLTACECFGVERFDREFAAVILDCTTKASRIFE
jgi:glycosyltransferase involved in cell wall biosynthesis